jgi:sec-independent protein translocase protein TatC
MLEDREMPLVEHLEELRSRLIVSLCAWALGTAALWGCSGWILTWLARPAGGLVFLAPTEAFFTRLKVAMFGGFLAALPLVLYEAWAFTACAMGLELRRVVRVLLPLSYLLFMAGAALSLFVVVPAAMRFLTACGTENVRPFMAVGPYVEFAAGLSMAFGAVFQLPLVLVGLNRAGLVSRETLSDKRPYVYVGAFIAAGVLTPGPDVFSQLALAFPTLALFELSLLAMRRA